MTCFQISDTHCIYKLSLTVSDMPKHAVLRAGNGAHGFQKGRHDRSEGRQNDEHSHAVTVRVLLSALLPAQKRLKLDPLQV